MSTLLDGLTFTGKSTCSLASVLADYPMYVKMQSAPLQTAADELGAR